MKYLYAQENPAAETSAMPPRDNTPAVVANRRKARGTQMGDVKMMKGVRKIRARIPAVRVTPVRNIRMEAVMKRVRNPRRCGE